MLALGGASGEGGGDGREPNDRDDGKGKNKDPHDPGWWVEYRKV